MGSAFDLLTELADRGVRHSLDLVDGTHLEGYVLEVDPHVLTFGAGGPLAGPEDIKVPLACVDLTSLAYYDEERHAWRKLGAERGSGPGRGADHEPPSPDFGSAAGDYARHRAGFPPSFFARTPLPGPVLDLGSGTGTIARGLAERGTAVVALDVSSTMLARAEALPARVAARAEQCPFRDGAFRAVVAGQCWHWFDGPRVAREASRLLVPGGRIVIAHFDYLAVGDGVAAQTERLILEMNPAWPWSGSDGRYERWRPHLESAGFSQMESSFWDVDVVYSHEDWRGRMRACNGVIALGDPARIAAFDAELAHRLAACGEDPLVVPHRVFVLSGSSAR